MKNFKVFVSAIMAGFCIGIGGAAYLSIENKVIGALFFAIGLMVICSYNFHLYTGKVCYALDNDKEYWIQLPIIWFGNLIGTRLMALMLQCTRVGSTLSSSAMKLCAIKYYDSLLSLFILGILCNIMIYIAVEGYKNVQHELGKYLSIFLGVAVFILCGFEHSVADMFYFWLAGVFNPNMFVRLIVITLGNAAGGIAVHETKKWLQKESEPKVEIE